MGWGLQVISWDCCSVPEATPEHMWGWHSAGSSLCAPHPPSSSGSLPLSAVAFPARKTSHSLCQGEPLCGYCWVLQNDRPRGAWGMKDSSTEIVSDHTHYADETHNNMSWTNDLSKDFSLKKVKSDWLNRKLCLHQVVCYTWKPCWSTRIKYFTLEKNTQKHKLTTSSAELSKCAFYKKKQRPAENGGIKKKEGHTFNLSLQSTDLLFECSLCCPLCK